MSTTVSTAKLELPASTTAVGRARRFLRSAARARRFAPVLDDAELLVSELVTNGIRYGLPPITLHVVCQGTRSLLVLVSDHSADPPQQCTAGPDAESGRGLMLVDHISDEWGVEPYKDGKTVWFTLTSAA